MAYTTIDDPSAYFHTQLYTGNGSTQSITNDGNSDLQPDLVWIKERNNAVDHQLQDSTRGVTKTLQANQTYGESTLTDIITSFNSDGFSLGSNASWNGNNDTYVAWQWKANGGTTVTNTDGATNGYNTTVQANQTAGFSIVKFNAPFDQGNGRYNLGHGLGATPEFIITKCSGASADWYVYHKDMGGSNIYLRLNLTAATSTTGARYTFYEPAFSSTIFNMDWNNIVLQNQDFICYCFVGVQGFSKFGSYVGNGLAEGPFIYTGFKPGFVMIKERNAVEEWFILDSKRNTFNAVDKTLYASGNYAEGTGAQYMDFLSNGIKIRNNHTGTNTNGNTYLYMAFAENPFVATNGVPATAR